MPLLRNVGRLTEVKSNVIMEVAAGSIAPAILLYNPYIKDDKTKEYSALKQFISAFLGLGTQLGVSIPISRAIDHLAKTKQIPYLPATNKINALKLLLGAAGVALTLPLYAFLVNKFLPRIMNYIKGNNAIEKEVCHDLEPVKLFDGNNYALVVNDLISDDDEKVGWIV